MQDRVRKYTERGFQRTEAEILVLIEESAVAIFAAFPEHFIVFGGATLVLFYDSPRFSRDLDLLASPAKLPASEGILGIVRLRIQPVAETFGLGQLEFRTDRDSADFVKQWVPLIPANVRSGARWLFVRRASAAGRAALPLHLSVQA